MANSDDDFEESAIVISKKKPRPIPSSRTKLKNGTTRSEEKWDFFDRSKAKADSLFIPPTDMIDLEVDSEEEKAFQDIVIIDEETIEKEDESSINHHKLKRNSSIPNSSLGKSKEKRRRSVTPPPSLIKCIASDPVDLTLDDDYPILEENFACIEPIVLESEYMPVESNYIDNNGKVSDLKVHHDYSKDDEIQIEIHHEPKKGQSASDEKSVIMVSRWEPISKLLDQVALHRGFSREETVLSFKGVHIFASASLGSVGVSFGDVIQSFHKEDFLLTKTKRSRVVANALKEASSENDGDVNEQTNISNFDDQSSEKITIKINFSNKKSYKVQVQPTETIQSIASKCAKWNNSIHPKLYFDGDVLAPTSTLQDHDIEEDDSLDAK